MQTKMFLVTDTFPYGKGEKSFIIPELSYLLKYFDVTVITRAGKETVIDTENITKLGTEIEVVKIADYMKSTKSNSLQIKLRILYLLDKKVRKEFMEILKEENVIHKTKYMLSYYEKACKFLDALKRSDIPLNSRKPVIFYTYWNTYATLALLMCKSKNPNIKVITRTHGYDLYNERTLCGRQPFRSYVNSLIDAIFFISKKGMEYYIDKFSKGNSYSIFHLNRLGTEDYNVTRCTVKEKFFNLISCSNVVPVKRIGLIIKALEKIDDDREIHWVHFGDGQDLTEIKSQAAEFLDAKENIHYTFTGFISNKKVIEYYEMHYVDCFITTSSSEGIPVSIMEACSFGIPIIATNVGGISEIVKDQVNGLLLSANPVIGEITDAIKRIYDLEEESVRLMRKHSRRIWEERYNGDKNFLEFVSYIKNNI